MGWLDRLFRGAGERAARHAAQSAMDRVQHAARTVGDGIRSAAEGEIERGRASDRMRAEREAQEAARRATLFGDSDAE